MKKYIFSIIIILIYTAALRADAPSFDRIINDYNSIKTITASIKQQVYMPGGEVRYFSGEYYAESGGNLRIDYFYPGRETVISNSTGLYWYIPERKTVYVQKGAHPDTGFLNPSFERIIEGSAADLELEYEGNEFYSFFKRAAVWRITSAKSGLTVKVWTDPDGLYVIRKFVLDSEGSEIVREIYSGHIYTGGVYLPSYIEMFARTPSGIVHSYTEYGNINVNTSLAPGFFVFKKEKDTVERGLDEM